MLASADTAVGAGPTASAHAWFSGGGRVGYDPKARAIVAAQDAPLKIFLRQEGDVAHAVTFLPGFPDGSFGWAKVWPHLPSAAEMPKLFVGRSSEADVPGFACFSSALERRKPQVQEKFVRSHNRQIEARDSYAVASLAIDVSRAGQTAQSDFARGLKAFLAGARAIELGKAWNKTTTALAGATGAA
jgi:hypothetical protein